MGTIAPAKRPRRVLSRPKSSLLNSLIYEVIDGRAIYCADYKTVLTGKKTKETVTGSSTLQWVLSSYLVGFMYHSLDKTQYWFAPNKSGSQIDKYNQLLNDVAVHKKSVLTPDKINIHYANVPAKVAVEIDVRVDISNPIDRNYINLKTRKLLEFGTDKVIWVFTNTQQVMIAERTANAWLTMNWNRDIELLDGQLFNIAAYLAQEGITV